MDPQVRIRIHTRMSWIRSTGNLKRNSRIKGLSEFFFACYWKDPKPGGRNTFGSGSGTLFPGVLLHCQVPHFTGSGYLWFLKCSGFGSKMTFIIPSCGFFLLSDRSMKSVNWNFNNILKYLQYLQRWAGSVPTVTWLLNLRSRITTKNLFSLKLLTSYYFQQNWISSLYGFNFTLQ
jgi:hypothetical protein